VAVLLALEFVCLEPLALLCFCEAGSVLIFVQLQRLLAVLGVALTQQWVRLREKERGSARKGQSA